MRAQISSGYLRLISKLLFLVLLSKHCHAQQFKNTLEFNTFGSLNVFSDKTNKIAGYVSGKCLAYNISVLNNTGLNSVGVIVDYRDLNKIRKLGDLHANRFGSAFAVIGVLNFSVINYNRFKLTFSPGLGFSYLDKTGYIHKNPIIKSHFNFATIAALKLSYEMDENTKILVGTNIIHFSNAAMRVPNHGMNIVGLSLGFAKYLASKSNRPLKWFDAKALDFNRHGFELGVNIGGRGVYGRKKTLYKSGASLGYKYRFNALLGAHTGIDAVYYYSVFDTVRFAETYQSKATSFDRWRMGIGAGPTLNIGKFNLTATYGYYLYFKSYVPIHTYWNAALRYKTGQLISYQAKLYGHREEIDFLGVGVVFNLAF